MGTRSQVLIEDIGIYLYQHWDGYDLHKKVKKALKNKWRWDDPEYLARIIFCEMVKEHEEEETGYGIGTSEHGDIEFLVIVNCTNRTVTVKDLNNEKTETKSFEEFIK